MAKEKKKEKKGMKDWGEREGKRRRERGLFD